MLHLSTALISMHTQEVQTAAPGLELIEWPAKLEKTCPSTVELYLWRQLPAFQ